MKAIRAGNWPLRLPARKLWRSATLSDQTILIKRTSVTRTTTYFFCGGGSGGHLFPGLAIAEVLRRREPTCKAVFIGSTREVEQTVLAGVAHEHIAVEMLPASALCRSPFRFMKTHRAAIARSLELLDKHRPAAVVGLGGFASVPVVTAAAQRGIPIILLEQNRVPGRATRWLARKAAGVCISFPETIINSSKPKVILTGNPVRTSIIAERSSSEPENVILVLGGSQGATRLNDDVMAAFSDDTTLPLGWRVAHQTGPRDESRVRSHYENQGIDAHVEAFFDDMSVRYQPASIVISRAGGTTLAELSCIGRASILVPYPNSVGDHQLKNAECFSESNAAILVQHGPDAASGLRDAVTRLVGDRNERERLAASMKLLGTPDAAARVADVVQQAHQQ